MTSYDIVNFLITLGSMLMGLVIAISLMYIKDVIEGVIKVIRERVKKFRRGG